MRNAVLKNTSGTVVGQWNGYGNTNADWLDQGTGNVGMWFDNADDKVTIPKPAVTVDVKMKVTQAGSGVHGMTLASSNSDSAFLFASQSGSSAAISYGSGSPTFTVDGVAVTTRAELFTALADGLEHEVIATGADLSGWTLMYVGNYTSDPPTTAWVWEGLIRDIRFYDSSTDALIHQYDGYGNTDADWKDQVGSNDGTVSGSPARAVATATGWRKANDGEVSGSPYGAASVDGGATWAEGEGPTGSYSDERGFLSSTDKIHDGEFWQDFSYQIRTTISESRWKDSYHRLVHPAGIRFFSLLLIEAITNNRWEDFINYEGTVEDPEAWYDSLIPPRLRQTNSYDASHTPRYQPGWLSSAIAIFIESLADSRLRTGWMPDLPISAGFSTNQLASGDWIWPELEVSGTLTSDGSTAIPSGPFAFLPVATPNSYTLSFTGSGAVFDADNVKIGWAAEKVGDIQASLQQVHRAYDGPSPEPSGWPRWQWELEYKDLSITENPLAVPPITNTLATWIAPYNNETSPVALTFTPISPATGTPTISAPLPSLANTLIKTRFQFEPTNFRSKTLHDGYLTGEGRYNPLFWQDERALHNLGYMDSTLRALTSNFNQHPLGTTPVNLSAGATVITS
jgi:hypothetical protein